MKSDVQIEKDKEAVAKMIGAKSAMEAMLRRHSEMESALKLVCAIFTELADATGDDLYMRTTRHGEGHDYKTVSIKTMRDRVRAIRDAVL